MGALRPHIADTVVNLHKRDVVPYYVVNLHKRDVVPYYVVNLH